MAPCLPYLRSSFSARSLVFVVICVRAISIACGMEPGKSNSAHAFAPPAADRKLNDSDLRELLSYCDFIIDRANPEEDRSSQAQLLGTNFRHKYCIPALLVVIRNPEEPYRLRQMAMMSLSAIDDGRVVDYLIEIIPDRVLGRQANEQLMKITGVSAGILNFKDKNASEAAKHIQQRWRNWWKKNWAQTKLRSNNAWDSEAAFYEFLEDAIEHKRNR